MEAHVSTLSNAQLYLEAENLLMRGRAERVINRGSLLIAYRLLYRYEA